MNKQFNILIISEAASFPWGMAASNRVRNLAKGAKTSQSIIEYMGLRGVSNPTPSKEYKKSGIFEGIKYFYPGGFSVRPTNWLMRRLDDILGASFSVLNVLYKKITGKIDLVIIYSRSYTVVSFWTRFLHFMHLPVVLEVCEWPLAKAESGIYKDKKARKYCYKAIPEVDAVIPISNYIDNEIRKIAKDKNKRIPSFLIPIIIDIDQHQFLPKRKIHNPYLLYSGYMGYIEIAKLVIDTLVELNNRGFNIPLIFTGSGPQKFFGLIKQYASEKNILHKIEFTGLVEEYKLYKLMGEALGLLAPLPDNLLTKARFSTKLGYYLISGTPVITNAVGDVELYLQDENNAYIAKDFNKYDFAAKIEQIITNPIKAEEVGRNGQKVAMNKFHYSEACRGFNSFLQDISSNFLKQ